MNFALSSTSTDSTISVQLDDTVRLNPNRQHFISISNINIPFKTPNVTNSTDFYIKVTRTDGEELVFTLYTGIYTGGDMTSRFYAFILDNYEWFDSNDLSVMLIMDDNINRVSFKFTNPDIAQVAVSPALAYMFGYTETEAAANAADYVIANDGSAEFHMGSYQPSITNTISDFFITTNLQTDSYTNINTKSVDSASGLKNILFHGYFRVPNSVNTFNHMDAQNVMIEDNTINSFTVDLVDNQFRKIDLDGDKWSLFFSVI
ncbi:hypothetical protein KIPB_004506 [Kipferlia bialata]|uniref:Uncharacterized protein n=1 Tax=Kipferlia bialata TaxID=797122 RepID=A0A391NKN4_9EUKA|nr:hypothetical protein KIPB_004506 [Kipferlia bialata]|eukprot:g4506.t1